MEPQQQNTLYQRLYSYDNLELAFNRAKKRKSKKPYIQEYEQNLKENLLQLKLELETETYYPKPLETFIIRDPKTRKISKSDFRDRIIHHAICNIVEPIFDKTFIHDSYANRIGKGTLKALKRFDEFKRKASKNNTRTCYVLKADIKHYFDTVDHKTLLTIISKKIKDNKTINLIKKILANYKTEQPSKGMPLGNLTSQFFANIYLNELDQYIKHELKAKYYIRYVDDFIIIDHDKTTLEENQRKISNFIKDELQLELHPDKTKIQTITQGIIFLGFRIFSHHKLVRKKNINKFRRKLKQQEKYYKQNKITYNKVLEKLEGWIAHTKIANTYKYRNRLKKTRINPQPKGWGILTFAFSN